jgi:hypothetical protein
MDSILVNRRFDFQYLQHLYYSLFIQEKSKVGSQNIFLKDQVFNLAIAVVYLKTDCLIILPNKR